MFQDTKKSKDRLNKSNAKLWVLVALILTIVTALTYIMYIGPLIVEYIETV